ncbi:MAG: acyltransferase family protein [Flavobacteriales bacterium]
MIHLQNKDYIPGIDGLRAIAAMAVLLSHATGNWGIFELGWIGVDLFFVISGFLITKILIENRGSSGYFKTFYYRRALRIIPIYAIVVIPLVCFHLWRNQVPFYVPLSYLIYLQNSFAIDYGWLPGLAHTWTLAIEEQFYLFFPIVIYLLRPRFLLATFVSAIFFIIGLRFFFYFANFYTYYQGVFTISRLDSFLMGGLVAIIAYYQIVQSIQLKNLIFNSIIVFSLSLLLIQIYKYGQNTTGFFHQMMLGIHQFKFKSNLISPYGQLKYSLLALLFAALLAKVVFQSSAFTQKMIHQLERPLIKEIGQMSYGLYLYHYIYVSLFRWFFDIDQAPPLYRIFLIFVIIIASYITARFSYFRIEKPFLKKRPTYKYTSGE